MLKFKIGDTVKITSGKDKGREGKIEKIFSKEKTVLIPTVNFFKRHMKGIGERKSGIYDIPRPLPFSKIALICPKCKKPTRVGFRVLEKEKIRVCRKCGKEINEK
jgi:large subunit ribosomal protein L24